MYLTIKILHVACVTLSALGFFLRGSLMLVDSPLLSRRWVRVLPHVNDSVLLAAAVVLALMLGQYPFVDAWLTAKFIGLVAYVSLGAVALGKRYAKRVHVMSWLAAMVVFAYIASVAITKSPFVFLAQGDLQILQSAPKVQPQGIGVNRYGDIREKKATTWCSAYGLPMPGNDGRSLFSSRGRFQDSRCPEPINTCLTC